jgi:large subunit ribosomal protein L24
MPIPVSNVAVLAADGKPTKVGYKVDDHGNKVRVARRTGEEL